MREELLNKIIGSFDLSGDGEIEREQLIPAVKKYQALLLHDLRLAELFTKHDTDSTNTLSPDQVLALLTEMAEEGGAEAPTAECDVAYVMEKCDSNADGVISLDELGPAVATWWEYARDLKPPASKSSACAIL